MTLQTAFDTLHLCGISVWISGTPEGKVELAMTPMMGGVVKHAQVF